MPERQWSFLEAWGERVVELMRDDEAVVPDERRIVKAVRAKGTPLGSPTPARRLEAAERRLGVDLPPDLLEFYGYAGEFVDFVPYDRCVHLRPASRAEWLIDAMPSLIEAYDDFIGAYDIDPDAPVQKEPRYGPRGDTLIYPAHLERCLLLSGRDQMTLYLLNPCIVGPGGEWEAWDFVPKHGSAIKFRSLYDLLRSRFRAVGRLGGRAS